MNVVKILKLYIAYIYISTRHIKIVHYFEPNYCFLFSSPSFRLLINLTFLCSIYTTRLSPHKIPNDVSNVPKTIYKYPSTRNTLT